MSIYEYGPDDHPAGFEGIRVSASVNRKHRQKYFSFKLKPGKRNTDPVYHTNAEIKRIRQRANDLEKQWLEEQSKHRTIREIHGGHFNTSVRNRTGIRGLTWIMYSERSGKNHSGKHKDIHLRINIHCGSRITGTRIATCKRVDDINKLEDAWREMTRKLARFRGLKRTPSSWIKAMPSRKEVKQARIAAEKKYGIKAVSGLIYT